MLSDDRIEGIEIVCYELCHDRFEAFTTAGPVAIANGIRINVKLLQAPKRVQKKGLSPEKVIYREQTFFRTFLLICSATSGCMRNLIIISQLREFFISKSRGGLNII